VSSFILTDEVVNDIISDLLDASALSRIRSSGKWSVNFDRAMTQWNEMHPGTNPPCWKKVGPPPPCFAGNVPPIYDGKLGDRFVSCNPDENKI